MCPIAMANMGHAICEYDFPERCAGAVSFEWRDEPILIEACCKPQPVSSPLRMPSVLNLGYGCRETVLAHCGWRTFFPCLLAEPEGASQSMAQHPDTSNAEESQEESSWIPE